MGPSDPLSDASNPENQTVSMLWFYNSPKPNREYDVTYILYFFAYASLKALWTITHHVRHVPSCYSCPSWTTMSVMSRHGPSPTMFEMREIANLFEVMLASYTFIHFTKTMLNEGMSLVRVIRSVHSAGTTVAETSFPETLRGGRHVGPSTSDLLI